MSRLASIRQWVLGLLACAPGFSWAQEPTPPPIAQGYLYVEPYQARVEVLFDAATMLRWQDPQAALPATLTVAAQMKLADAVSGVAAGWCELQTDGAPLPGAFIGASVIKGKPGNTLPFEGESDLALTEALVGLIWEFPTSAAPEEITIAWQGFASLATISKLPIRVFFGPLSETLAVTSDASRTTWRSEGRLPPISSLAAVPAATAAPKHWRWLAFAWLGVGMICILGLAVKQWPRPGGTSVAVILWLVGGSTFLVLDNLGRAATRITTAAQAQAILHPLLRNVYRAFDHRAESEIYDVLARSVEGELLRKLYLETVQALTLDGREGTRVTINEFDATVSAVRANPAGPGFIADCQWTALGRVGHWGHTHTRVNRYTAQVTVTPKSPDWKITHLEVTETRRL